jgi:iron(II)-dependent oxidoreductase
VAPRILIFILFVHCLVAQDTNYLPSGQQIPGPPSKAATAEWLRDIRTWRDERRVRAGLTGENYQRPELT